MPKLRNLSGQDVVRTLVQRGFKVVRIRDSYHILRRTFTTPDKKEVQNVNVPVYGNKPLAAGMLKRLYNDLQRYVPEADLHDCFYSD